MTDETIPRDEVAASLATSQELGSDYDNAVADALAERIERTVDERVEARLAERLAETRVHQHRQDLKVTGLRFSLAVVSMVLAIPVTFIAAGSTDPGPAVAMVWLGITAVNAAFYFATRR
ncbi:hypothetical protein [Halostreptopolyspora alba]|uniref:Uncharacterized protein n=1 Tax=Halostreptopolyspora alba TaxID=2487137 RepID=A0A3N0E470_9ACTN|nr:hypothetical protein EFW17_18310 [Nocardiopsaceae bacterium YIM 96095]